MKRSLILSILGATAIAGGLFYLKKNSKNSSADLAVENSPEVYGKIGKPTAKQVQSSSGTVVAPATKPPSIDEQKNYEDKLHADGYVDNPNDPYTLIRKVKKNDGREVIYLMPKAKDENVYSEPPSRDKKTAEEILESKKDLNPAEEIRSLKSLDDKDQNDLILLGRFRDEANDLELFFAPLSDLSDKPLGQDMICFVAPKLNLYFKRIRTGKVGSDGAGYAVLKLNEQVYVRTTWSFENKRILHGQILTANNGQLKVLKSFEAIEVSKDSRASLKYCD